MSKYIIKTNKKGEGEYHNDFCDENGKIINNDTILDNKKTVSDILYYYSLSIVPFIRTAKLNQLEVKIEINKNDN
jgi:hypothetical protein